MKPNQSLTHDNSKTVAFRLSEEDFKTFQMLADTSGMVRQDFIRERLLACQITVYPNVRVRKYLEDYLVKISEELTRIRSSTELTEEMLDRIDYLISFISQL